MGPIERLTGRRLSSEEGTEHVGVLATIETYGLDALGSAAYVPEAARVFTHRGRRLAYATGNVVVSVRSPAVLVISRIAVVIAKGAADPCYRQLIHKFHTTLLKWRMSVRGNRRVANIDMFWRLQQTN